MAPLCESCGENINKLKHQVSVMRKEIKNLRQALDSAIRSHCKHLTAIQSTVSKIGCCGPEKSQPPPSPQAGLEQGSIQTVPIGYMSSSFSVKNGTPRQPSICAPSRAELRIQKSVFNNPEHALVGLEQYSHIWIIFLFHKNGHMSYKAKVKPPRLNGQRVGVYSTRSPHRPNALGLTLAKVDRIDGDTIHLSDVDMIAGTPVLDIKPYIPEYDSPQARAAADLQCYKSDVHQQTATAGSQEESSILNFHIDSEIDVPSNPKCEQTSHCHDDEPESLLPEDKPRHDMPRSGSATSSSSESVRFSLLKDLQNVLEEAKTYVTQGDLLQLNCEDKYQMSDSAKTRRLDSAVECPRYGEEAYSTVAAWIREPPVSTLEVRFTPHAEKDLAKFFPSHLSGPSECSKPRFKFLRSPEEAACAIRGLLSADPRSVYRRTCCKDRLFFFTLDMADITCWFGMGFAEVLQVQPLQQHVASW
ncbi:tRNA (adenine(37)-N6)-methyltransferase [Thalassophryne amazonica]|uniref:tRNA (adenine(37)-N6)-methyltransferase n=1 Tax=Thalassophryne amazonica TaxID=390379 RepID=UPI0014717CFB|nr:tRNA (adenine(37)-N6)-methyltransferase [Thalassophryne amazonica]